MSNNNNNNNASGGQNPNRVPPLNQNRSQSLYSQSQSGSLFSNSYQSQNRSNASQSPQQQMRALFNSNSAPNTGVSRNQRPLFERQQNQNDNQPNQRNQSGSIQSQRIQGGNQQLNSQQQSRQNGRIHEQNRNQSSSSQQNRSNQRDQVRQDRNQSSVQQLQNQNSNRSYDYDQIQNQGSNFQQQNRNQRGVLQLDLNIGQNQQANHQPRPQHNDLGLLFDDLNENQSDLRNNQQQNSGSLNQQAPQRGRSSSELQELYEYNDQQDDDIYEVDARQVSFHFDNNQRERIQLEEPQQEGENVDDQVRDFQQFPLIKAINDGQIIRPFIFERNQSSQFSITQNPGFHALILGISPLELQRGLTQQIKNQMCGALYRADTVSSNTSNLQQLIPAVSLDFNKRSQISLIKDEFYHALNLLQGEIKFMCREFAISAIALATSDYQGLVNKILQNKMFEVEKIGGIITDSDNNCYKFKRILQFPQIEILERNFFPDGFEKYLTAQGYFQYLVYIIDGAEYNFAVLKRQGEHWFVLTKRNILLQIVESQIIMNVIPQARPITRFDLATKVFGDSNNLYGLEKMDINVQTELQYKQLILKYFYDGLTHSDALNKWSRFFTFVGHKVEKQPALLGLGNQKAKNAKKKDTSSRENKGKNFPKKSKSKDCSISKDKNKRRSRRSASRDRKKDRRSRSRSRDRSRKDAERKKKNYRRRYRSRSRSSSRRESSRSIDSRDSDSSYSSTYDSSK